MGKKSDPTLGAQHLNQGWRTWLQRVIEDVEQGKSTVKHIVKDLKRIMREEKKEDGVV